MNPILKTRLKDCGLSINDIIENSIVKGEVCIYVYTSHLEGLGTNNSDIDVYVVCKDIPKDSSFVNCDDCSIQNIVINSILLDIEYWSINKINTILDKLNNKSNITLSETKLIQKLYYSELVYNNEEKLNVKENIDINNLKKIVFNRYILEANSYLEDSINMYIAKEYISSLNCAFNALQNAIGAFNTFNNAINVKEKWIAKLFLVNKAYNNKIIYQKYIKYQIYTNINPNNIIEFLENKIEFIKEILENLIL